MIFSLSPALLSCCYYLFCSRQGPTTPTSFASMSTKVPGSWPTLRGCLNDESQSGAGSGAGSLLTKNDVPRNHEEGVGAGVSFRSGTKMPGVWPTVESCGSGKAVGSSMGIVSSTLRKKVLEGMFENPKPAGFGGDDEELHVGNGVDVSGKRVIPAPECITDRRSLCTCRCNLKMLNKVCWYRPGSRDGPWLNRQR